MTCFGRCCDAPCDRVATATTVRYLLHDDGITGSDPLLGAPPHTFTVTLADDGADDPSACLGITLDCLDGQTALVGKLWDHGRIAAHNRRASRCVSYVGDSNGLVHPGDYIIAVNGSRGSVRRMVALMINGGPLELNVATAEEFSISFDNGGSSSRPLGLSLKWYPNGWSLLIEEVGPGVVKDWNRAHPEQQVRRNDRIVAIDGCRTHPEDLAASDWSGLTRMLDQLDTSSMITFSRPAVPVPLRADEDSGEDSGIDDIVILDNTTAPALDTKTNKSTQDHDSVAQNVSKALRPHYLRELSPTHGYFEAGVGCTRSRSEVSNEKSLTMNLYHPSFASPRSPSLSPSHASETKTANSICTTLLDNSLVPEVGTEVYYCAGNKSFPRGDVLHFGTKGEVVNIILRSGAKSNTLVEVKFDGSTRHVGVPPSQLTLTTPTLPAGFEMGDEVVFVGKRAVQVSSTDMLTPGLAGLVMGLVPAKQADPELPRLSIRFHGHMKCTPLPVNAVRRAHGNAA